MTTFRQKNYAKMSIFLAKALKIRDGWGLCPQTPLASALGASPPHPRLGHLLCRILGAPQEKPMKFCPPPRNFGLATPL